MIDYTKAPAPWFGGKAHAAPLVWSLLGDCVHYVEPFAGMLGVLLNRPHPCNRPYYSETINDADALICNAWRAIQWHPEETARHASWPVTECDKQSRQIAVLKWCQGKTLDLLSGSPEWCDPKMAGWWLYGVCCQIGAIKGPWTADPVSGRIVKQTGTPGGVRRNLPHLGDDGRGVNHAGLREPGVRRDRPHLGDNGRGVNHAGLREPGVLSDDPANEFHALTMPELIRWFQWLAARLRHVRIVNGDWKRVCTSGAMFTLPVRQGNGPCAVFLDPPYSSAERSAGLYRDEHDSGDVTAECRKWCLKWGKDKRLRIVLAGYDTEHRELEEHGWTVHEWFRAGHLRGGMGNVAGSEGHQQRRERLWASPFCLRERGLFDEDPAP